MRVYFSPPNLVRLFCMQAELPVLPNPLSERVRQIVRRLRADRPPYVSVLDRPGPEAKKKKKKEKKERKKK